MWVVPASPAWSSLTRRQRSELGWHSGAPILIRLRHGSREPGARAPTRRCCVFVRTQIAVLRRPF
jgi:hypothetical protein